jgi:hypothetical protein
MKTINFEVSAFLLVTGEHFTPRVAEQKGVIFSEKNEHGDIGRTGKFKNKPIPYGSGKIEIDISTTENNFLPEDLGRLGKPGLIELLHNCGAEDVALYVNIGYTECCNFELTPTLLMNLAKIGIPVGVSCYEM